MKDVGLLLQSDLFQSAIEQVPASIVITDQDGNIEFVNTYFTEKSGYSFEEAVGRNPRILKSGKQSKDFYADLWGTITSGKIWHGEFQNLRKDGSLYWEKASISPVIDEAGTITNYIAVKQDITESKRREKQAIRRERLFNDVQKLSKTGGWEYDVATERTFWTDELYKIHAFRKPYMQDHIDQSLQCYYEMDRKAIEKAFNTCVKKGRPYDMTVRFIDMKGNHKWVRTKSHAIFWEDGTVRKVVGSVKDVTVEVTKELALKESDKKFRGVVNSFDDIVFTLDLKGRHTNLFGNWYDEKDKSNFLGKDPIEVFGEREGKIHMQAFQNVLNGEHILYNWSQIKDGKETYYQTRLSPIREDDQSISGFLGVGRNISSEIEAQKELQTTKDRLNFALEGTQAGTWDLMVKTGDAIYNDRWFEMLGYSPSDFEYNDQDLWIRLSHPDDAKYAMQAIKDHYEGRSDYLDIKIRMKHKGGHWVWIWGRGKVIEWDEYGNPVRMTGTHVDISDWVDAEEKLKLSEKRYRDLFTKSSDPNLLIKNAKIIDCNNALLNVLGYDNKNELVGRSPLDISPEIQQNGKNSLQFFREIWVNVMRDKNIRFEWLNLNREGIEIPFEVMVTLIPDTEGDDILFVVLRDIRDRKQAETQIMESLNEKAMLLAEIHHRVKNNLAIISGLMQLQMFNSASEEDTEVLNKSINRIKSIALIHEQLYQSDSFTKISLKENIEKQVQTLLEMYESDLSANVEIELYLKQVSININQALPVGLLLNEIINNAFKHAFIGKEVGKIIISLEEQEETIYLMVKDDGVGLNSYGNSEETSSLGKTLIETFLSQLEATYKIDATSGTAYYIEFNKENIGGSMASNLNLS